MKKEILIIVKSSIERSPRSSRFLDFCFKNNFNITLVSGGIDRLNIQINESFVLSIVEKSQLERVFFKLFKLFINIDFFQRISNEYLQDIQKMRFPFLTQENFTHCNLRITFILEFLKK